MFETGTVMMLINEVAKKVKISNQSNILPKIKYLGIQIHTIYYLHTAITSRVLLGKDWWTSM